MIREILLFLFIQVFAISLYSQTTSRNVSKTGTTAANFLEIPVGASAMGMGAAFVSIANDATALYWNASGISSLTQNELKVVHTNWIAQTNFDYAALVIPMGSFGTLGMSFTSLSMPDMKVTTVELPEGTGEFFSAGDIAVSLSYARGITDRFSIGFNAKFIQQTIWHEKATGFAIDAGTIFRTDLLNGLVIGASISNFGTSMKLSGRDTRTFNRVDPTKLGSNDEVPYNIELDSWDLPLTFQIGISTNIVNSSDFKWTIAVDAVHPSDNYESMNTGTELSYRNIFFIRGGFQSLFLNQAEGGLSLGAGIYANNILGSTSVQFDYAYRDFGRLENIHVFGVGLRF